MAHWAFRVLLLRAVACAYNNYTTAEEHRDIAGPSARVEVKTNLCGISRHQRDYPDARWDDDLATDWNHTIL